MLEVIEQWNALSLSKIEGLEPINVAFRTMIAQVLLHVPLLSIYSRFCRSRSAHMTSSIHARTTLMRISCCSSMILKICACVFKSSSTRNSRISPAQHVLWSSWRSSRRSRASDCRLVKSTRNASSCWKPSSRICVPCSIATTPTPSFHATTHPSRFALLFLYDCQHDDLMLSTGSYCLVSSAL